MSQRSLGNKGGGSGGCQNRRWPLDLDYGDPEGIAAFTLAIGYDPDRVVNTLVMRCKLDVITARSIVKNVLNAQPIGGSK